MRRRDVLVDHRPEPRGRRRLGVAPTLAALALALGLVCGAWPDGGGPAGRVLARLALAAPHLLGFERPVTYLVLVQNRAELRATGGFITAVGTLRLERGALTDAHLTRVYAAEPPPTPGRTVQPPEPLVRSMGIGDWRLRDANWWPDFRETARQAAAFWSAGDGPVVDGVIALDDTALERLALALGPLELPDGEQLEAEALRSYAMARAFPAGDEGARRAEQAVLTAELAEAFARGWREATPTRRARLVGAALDLLNGRHILVAAFDPAGAAALRALDVDGALAAPDGDWLAVVEDNLSYSKLSLSIDGALRYDVALDARARPVRARLTLDYTHTLAPERRDPLYPVEYYDGARWDPVARRLERRSGYYGGYVRIFAASPPWPDRASGFDGAARPAPCGSGASAGAGTPSRGAGSREATASPRTEGGGRCAWPGVGGYLGLGPGETRHIVVEWEPRAEAAGADTYVLQVRRQPGAPDRALTVHVALPPEAVPAWIRPAPSAVTADGVEWHLRLDRDQRLAIRLAPVPGSSR